jgi:small-conductance mechanosensitive channel
MRSSFFLTFAFFLFLFTSGFAQDTDSMGINRTNSSHLEKQTPAYVVFQGDTLFALYASFGPFSPAERATMAMEHLNELVEHITEIQDSFRIAHKHNYSLISYKGFSLTSINDEDVIPLGIPRQQAANDYVAAIRTSLQKNLEHNSFMDWLVNIGLTALTLIGLILIFYLINRFFKWLNTKLKEYEKNLKRKRTSLFRYLAPKGPDSFFIFLSSIVKYAIIVLILLLYLPLLFSFLPWTKGIVEQFYSYIADPVKYVLLGLWNFLPNLFFIIIILLVARYFVRILSYASDEVEKEKLKIKGFHKDWAKPTANILKVIIYAFALVFIFPYLPGSDSPAFQGVSIFLGVLFSLGSTSAIANLVAGIVITYMRPFTVGDRVKIGDTIGTVVEKSMLVTKIRTLKNEEVTIPNAQIINTHLLNYTNNAKELGVILYTSITIGYDVPWQTVNDLLLKAAKKTKLLSRDNKPFILQKSLDDFYVEYELNVYTRQVNKMTIIYSELHKNILEVFHEAGVEILSPHYNALRDGNPSTIRKDGSTGTDNPVEKAIKKVTGQK